MRVICGPYGRRTVGASLCVLGALWGAHCAPGAVAFAATATTPAKDRFVGDITRATGKLAGDNGGITALLHVVQSTDPVRKLRVTMLGAPCGTAKHCLRLSGVLSGTISAHAGTIPDVGRRYDLSLRGGLGTFNRVTVTGTVAGVGFIKQGRETLILRVQTTSGRLVVTALSPKVPGLTSP